MTPTDFAAFVNKPLCTTEELMQLTFEQMDKIANDDSFEVRSYYQEQRREYNRTYRYIKDAELSEAVA